MQRSAKIVLSAVVAATMALAGCGTGMSKPSNSSSGEITLAGWSLSTTPEFQALADGFNATNPAHKVKVLEYDATNYDTQMVADLAAHTAPDIYIQKNLKNFYTYQSGDQLLDVSDIAADLGKNVKGTDRYAVNGKTWAIPYRQDGWVLFYNKDMFKKAGVAYPDGSWTWDDYSKAAKQLTEKLKSSNVKGTYMHLWQSLVQGFALAQTPGADLLSGDFSYLKPYYDRALDLQASGAQEDYGNVKTNKLTYQAQFGTQKTAMMPMGSWYTAALLAQQKSGDAQHFDWGIAPIPQRDSSTTGTNNTPVTFGDPTGLGINPAISKDKVETAKAFLRYAASEDGAKVLAGISLTPAYSSDVITHTFFASQGLPTDDLSKFAFSVRDVKPENPVSPNTAALQNILNDTHSAIMSKSVGAQAGLDQAKSRAKTEVLHG